MPYSETGGAQKDAAGTLTSNRRPLPAVLGARQSFPRPIRWVAVAAVSCAFLITASTMLVDRPVATWVHEHLRDAQFPIFTAHYEAVPLVIGPFSLMAGPAEVLGPVAVIVLAIQALLAAAGYRPTMRGRIILTLSLSILVAMQVNATLKTVFGRTWPETWIGNNPSWIRDGMFGFFPFHGGKGWGSFPSGHTTVIAAPAAVLWMVWPKLRVLWATTVVVVIAGLIGGNYHFVSDTIAGVYLGIGIGIAIAALTLPRKDYLNWSILRGSPPTEDPISDRVSSRRQD